MIEITAKKKVGDVVKEALITYDFGKNLAEMVKKFGEEIVFTNARSSFKITAQAAMRRYLDTGVSSEEIVKKMSSWKPGVTLERVIDPVAALLGKWGDMSEKEKADVLKKLKTQ